MSLAILQRKSFPMGEGFQPPIGNPFPSRLHPRGTARGSLHHYTIPARELQVDGDIFFGVFFVGKRAKTQVRQFVTKSFEPFVLILVD